MVNIVYSETDEKDITVIKPLWEQLNERHCVLSLYFTLHYETFTFEQRRDDLLNKITNGSMHISLAKDTDSGRYVGYCISTLVHDMGEVDSIFVEESYRSKGIGDALMKKALEWMGTQQANVIRVAVGAGNEEVLPFYARYGFYTRMTVLEQIKK